MVECCVWPLTLKKILLKRVKLIDRFQLFWVSWQTIGPSSDGLSDGPFGFVLHEDTLSFTSTLSELNSELHK